MNPLDKEEVPDDNSVSEPVLMPNSLQRGVCSTYMLTLPAV